MKRHTILLALLGGWWLGASCPTTADPSRLLHGPLRVHAQNPRYFTDASGRAILLVGSHTWDNLQDMGQSHPPSAFDFTAYRDFLAEHNHNFIRLWRWELVGWDTKTADEKAPRHLVCAPHPWARTGPGDALDGKPRFNLDRFDETYFQRLRARVTAAADRGIYVSVMLFEGWGIQHVPDAWAAHPFNIQNNVNGLNGDADGDGRGIEINTLRVPAVVKVQESYARKVIDTVNDLDNVLYEIVNESGAYSTAWQEHFIRFIKDCEARQPKQHPVGMTFQWSRDAKQRGSNAALFSSPADWVSPNPDAGRFSYRTNPPAATGAKVILTDTDHLWGIGGNPAWVWKSFLRGLNPIFMDPYEGKVLNRGTDPKWTEPVRKSMGQVLQWSRRVDLAALTPQPALASSEYCLAAPGREYLVYLPDGKETTVDLSGDDQPFEVEWFDPATGQTRKDKPRRGGGRLRFVSPFQSKDAVLHLKRPAG